MELDTLAKILIYEECAAVLSLKSTMNKPGFGLAFQSVTKFKHPKF